jgi:sec-independent protein translocase protein TatB
MFDIGWGELVLIGIVALIAIGPKELPTVLRTLGQYMGKIKRMASEFQGQFQEAMREAEMDDLKKQADELTSAVTDATKFDPLADIDNDGGTDTDTDTDTDFDTVEPEKLTPEGSEPETSELATTDASGETEEASQAAASEPEKLSDVNVPPPEPVAEQDLAPAEPPPKQAGGKA